eukprot:CAMPEP_0179061906 /NCGR_PEP_ID=MMETSP0796-20121207/26656_1 /TAXON_ID=73915 /ORGANISM="Pyrodinium bahamense, Strain pbaha01" /LENGTH=45 /DNA_ID= /DNA_START= /DNA_END= /DNA_ORIENTATION=
MMEVLGSLAGWCFQGVRKRLLLQRRADPTQSGPGNLVAISTEVAS